VTAGTRPRRRLRKLKTNVHTKRAVIRIVPISASNAAFLSVMIGVWTLAVSGATLAPALGLPQTERPPANRGWYRKRLTRTFGNAGKLYLRIS
jgi:hypothetical protein